MPTQERKKAAERAAGAELLAWQRALLRAHQHHVMAQAEAAAKQSLQELNALNLEQHLAAARR